MRRYNQAIALLVSLSLVSGCRSDSTHRRWPAPVRAMQTCVSVITGDSTQNEEPALPRSAPPHLSPAADAESDSLPDAPSESDAPTTNSAGPDTFNGDIPVQEVSVDHPAPLPAEEGPANDSSGSLEESLPPAEPIETLRLLGGDFKFSEDGALLFVDLSQTTATDAHVELLTQIASLRAVDLSGTHVTPAGLKGLFQSSDLQMLGLCDLPIDDQTIRDIVDLEELRFLSLERTAITDDGLRYLRALIHLEGVSVRGTNVSREAIREFERAHPKCRVLADGDEEESSFPIGPTGQFPRRPDRTGTISKSDSPPPLESPAQPARMARSAGKPSPSVPVSTDDQARVVQQLQQIISERLSDQAVLAAAGRVYLAQGRWEDAVSVLSAALEQNPDDDRVRFDLAVALGHHGNIDESLRQFTEVIGSAAAHYNMGVILYEDDKISMSRYFFRQASERDPHIAFPEELASGKPSEASPGLQIQQDAMPAVSSSELLRLVAGPVQQSRPDANWTIEIVPGAGLNPVPRCLTTLRSEDTQPALPAVTEHLEWASPIGGWTSAE